MNSFWFQKPDLQTIEPLVAELLPQAISHIGGICEPNWNGFAIAVDATQEIKFQLEGIADLTPYSSFAGGERAHISLAHPLIQDFAESVLAHTPIDIIRLVLDRPRPPERVLEKLPAALTLRPAKIELDKIQSGERIWVHSIYLLGLEAMDYGQQLKHFVQEETGRFLPNPEDLLFRMQEKTGELHLENLDKMPVEMVLPWQKQLSEKSFQSEFKSEIAGLQNEEISKATTYYEHLELDLIKRRDREENKLIQRNVKDDGLQKSLKIYSDKLDRLRAERDLRLRNIVERFHAQFVVQPIGARILIIPTYICHFKPQQKFNSSLKVSYCPILREFQPPLCDRCYNPVRDLTLSTQGYICLRCRSR